MPTVLVCDDSSLARETLRHAVSAVPGVERVLEAASGEEALARWAVERPDVTLMDIRMPGLGGVEATRRLLALHPDATVVMLTMGEDVDGAARAVKAGACGYVVKDSSIEELAASVSYVLTAGQARRPAPVPRRRPASAGSPRCPSASSRCWRACPAGRATPRSGVSSTCPRTP